MVVDRITLASTGSDTNATRSVVPRVMVLQPLPAVPIAVTARDKVGIDRTGGAPAYLLVTQEDTAG